MSDRRLVSPRISFQAIARLAELADYTIAFAIRAVCNLGVADHLAEGPRRVEELSAAVGAHEASLLRALRALAAKGIFVEPSPGCFELTSMGHLLRSDHSISMREAFRMFPDIEALASLDYSIRTGKPAFDHIYGEGYFDYLPSHPELLAEFHASQRALTRLELLSVLRTYDWSAIRTVVDVGGGDGTFLSNLLVRNRTMYGTLFDLPDTAAAAPKILADAGVSDRCNIVSGSFFETPIPSSADAYLIKRVLVGLSDERVATLLHAISTAMRPDSRLLIFEPLRGLGDNLSTTMDLLMLVLGYGRVRTPDELETVLTNAGLKLTRLVAGTFPLIEAQLS